MCHTIETTVDMHLFFQNTTRPRHSVCRRYFEKNGSENPNCFCLKQKASESQKCDSEQQQDNSPQEYEEGE